MSRWIPACLTAGLLLAPAVRRRADQPAEGFAAHAGRNTAAVAAAAPSGIGPRLRPSCRTISAPSFVLQEIQSATTLPRITLRDELVGVQSGGPVLDYRRNSAKPSPSWN